MIQASQSLPYITRVINRIGEKYIGKSDAHFRLDGDELQETVSRRFSLTDYGDSYFRDGLGQLIDSIKNDTDLTFLGKYIQRKVIERSLENRLKFVDFYKRCPKIDNQKLIPPIFVLGLPRTGTTFLHRLLAQDPRNRGLYLWELVRPIPSLAGKDMRRIRAKFDYNIFRNLLTRGDHIHITRDNEYDECIMALTFTLHSVVYWISAPVYSYFEWLLYSDRKKIYSEYKQLLKIYQSTSPKKRLVLKAPSHIGALEEINTCFPGAIFIQTHRNPIDAVVSLNSLLYRAHCNVSKRVDVTKTAQCVLKVMGHDVTRSMNYMKRHDISIYDISYGDLLSDPIKAIKNIYKKNGIGLPDDIEQKMKRYIDHNPQHKYGVHKYCAADFGLTSGQIVEHFEEYMHHYGFAI